MIILGVILIIVGAALAYFIVEPIARFGAAVLVIAGVICVVIGLLSVSHTHTASYGKASPVAMHGKGSRV